MTARLFQGPFHRRFAAETLQVPIASLLRNHFLSGLARSEGGSDWAALARMAARKDFDTRSGLAANRQ